MQIKLVLKRNGLYSLSFYRPGRIRNEYYQSSNQVPVPLSSDIVTRIHEVKAGFRYKRPEGDTLKTNNGNAQQLKLFKKSNSVTNNIASCTHTAPLPHPLKKIF